MPIYEYECQKCKTRSEVFQKISDKPLKKCRECGGRLEKLWSPTGFQFKGSGWYVTDYAGRKTEASETAKETSGGKAEKETKSSPDTSASNGNAEAKKSEKKTEKVATPAKAKKD
jgi:putative FmdB family regulatory protein